MFNFQFQAILLFQSLTFFLLCTKKFAVWTLAAFWLALLNYLKHDMNILLLKNVISHDMLQINEFLIIFAWFLLKNISYSLERIDAIDERDEKFRLMNFVGYVFYFPTLIAGPHVLFTRYFVMLESRSTPAPLMDRTITLLLNLIRYSFWFFLTEFALHFFYMHTIVTSVDLTTLSTLAFFGVGYLVGQFFNVKYIIHYGVPIAMGNFDGISMPNKPKCICRIHKYSDMWKWFDHGLYEFLFRYIYTELCFATSKWPKKLFAGIATFFFVYIWHGFFDNILIWSVMNCLSILVEKCIYSIIESKEFRSKVLSFTSLDNYHRLHAFIGAQILIPAILSNFFFFGGTSVGWEFIRRTYFMGMWNYLQISLCIYFLFPIAEAVKRFEKNKE